MKIASWLTSVAKEENKAIDSISYTFCSDNFLLDINRNHLDHDYYTDIITFPYAYDPIESDIYISLDRVVDNADEFGVSFAEELHRVIVHGLLHMCGYNDASPADKKLMREKEDYYLGKL